MAMVSNKRRVARWLLLAAAVLAGMALLLSRQGRGGGGRSGLCLDGDGRRYSVGANVRDSSGRWVTCSSNGWRGLSER